MSIATARERQVRGWIVTARHKASGATVQRIYSGRDFKTAAAARNNARLLLGWRYVIVGVSKSK